MHTDDLISEDIKEYLTGIVFTAAYIPVEIPVEQKDGDLIILPDGAQVYADTSLVKATVLRQSLDASLADTMVSYRILMFSHTGFAVPPFDGRLRLLRKEDIVGYVMSEAQSM